MMRLCHSITLGSVIIYGKILLTNQQQKMTVLNAAHLEACLGIGFLKHRTWKTPMKNMVAPY